MATTKQRIDFDAYMNASQKLERLVPTYLENPIRTLTIDDVKEFAARGQAMAAYPRKGEIVLNGFQVYKATPAAIKFAKEHVREYLARKNPVRKVTLYSHLPTRKTAGKKTVRKTAAKNPRRKIKTIEHKTFGKSSFSVFDAKTKKFLGAFPSLLAAKQYGQAYADLHDKQVSILK